MNNFYASPVPKQPPPAPPRVPPRPISLRTPSNSTSSGISSSGGDGGGGGQSQGPVQKKSVSSSASAVSGLYEDRASDLGPRANETRCSLRSLYLYDPNMDAYETPADERPSRVFDTRFVEACEKSFCALRYCSLASRHLQSLLSYASSIPYTHTTHIFRLQAFRLVLVGILRGTQCYSCVKILSGVTRTQWTWAHVCSPAWTTRSRKRALSGCPTRSVNLSARAKCASLWLAFAFLQRLRTSIITEISR